MYTRSYSPSLAIINPSENVLDLGITMSRNCSFDVHINIICKKCTDLSGWIWRTFTYRDSTTLMTLNLVNIGLLLSVMVASLN